MISNERGHAQKQKLSLPTTYFFHLSSQNLAVDQ